MRYTMYDKATGEIKAWGITRQALLPRMLARHPSRDALEGNYRPEATIIDVSTKLPIALSREERETRENSALQALSRRHA